MAKWKTQSSRKCFIDPCGCRSLWWFQSCFVWKLGNAHKSWYSHLIKICYCTSKSHLKLGIGFGPLYEYNNTWCWIIYLMFKEMINSTFRPSHMCVYNLNQKSITTITNGKLILKWQQWWWHYYNDLGWILMKANLMSISFVDHK